METLKDRLQEVMQDLRLAKAKDLAIFCDVSEGLVTQWFSGQTKLGPKPLKAFARTRFNIDWIADGTLPKYRKQASDEEYGTSAQYSKVVVEDPDNHTFAKIRKIKLQLSAGITGFSPDLEHDEGDPIVIPRRWLIEKGYSEHSLIAIAVKGDSMEPTLRSGDTVIINTADKKPQDGAVFAVNYEGEDVVKRMSRDIGQWWLCSDNPDQQRYHRKVCQGDACIMIGRIVRRISDHL